MEMWYLADDSGDESAVESICFDGLIQSLSMNTKLINNIHIQKTFIHHPESTKAKD